MDSNSDSYDEAMESDEYVEEDHEEEKDEWGFPTGQVDVRLYLDHVSSAIAHMREKKRKCQDRKSVPWHHSLHHSGVLCRVCASLVYILDAKVTVLSGVFALAFMRVPHSSTFSTEILKAALCLASVF